MIYNSFIYFYHQVSVSKIPQIQKHSIENYYNFENKIKQS